MHLTLKMLTQPILCIDKPTCAWLKTNNRMCVPVFTDIAYQKGEMKY